MLSSSILQACDFVESKQLTGVLSEKKAKKISTYCMDSVDAISTNSNNRSLENYTPYAVFANSCTACSMVRPVAK